jgi:hypothetical protein
MQAMPFPNPATQFKPGQSGNPGGRPKRTITAKLRDLLDSTELDDEPVKPGMQVIDELAKVIVKKAKEGDFRFVNLLINRVDGKVPDTVVNNSDAAIEVLRAYLFGDTEPPDSNS